MKTLQISALALATTALASMCFAATELSMWYHGAGNETEAAILNGIIDDFNNSQEDWTIALQSFPQSSYNDSVNAAALAGELPEFIDSDRATRLAYGTL